MALVVEVPAAAGTVLDDTGAYTGAVRPDHLIRVWYDLDVRLLMADLYAKLTLSKR